MASQLDPIECSAQPLGFSFHPKRHHLVATALIDGTLEIHDFAATARNAAFQGTPKGAAKRRDSESDSDDEHDTIVSSIPVHTTGTVPQAAPAPALVPPATSVGAGRRRPDRTPVIPRARRKPSCRSVLFSSGTNDPGSEIFTAGNGGGICCLDADRACAAGCGTPSSGVLWRVERAHRHGVNALHQLPPSAPAGPLLASGDDEGVVRLWDARTCSAGAGAGSFNDLMGPPRGCVASWEGHNADYISGFDTDGDGVTLLASSADCTLSVFDVRRPGTKVNSNDGSGKGLGGSSSVAARKSDDQEDELLSIAVVKNGRKVLCGTQRGVLAVWSWGTWGDVSDRFPGHPASIDALLKVDEETVLTGSSDGLIRAVQIHPDKFLGVLGDHDGFPVEALHFSAGKNYIGSMSHDDKIRLWDASILGDEGNDDDGNESGDMDEVDVINQSDISGAVHATATGAGVNDSDDEWEDMDSDEDMEDGNDSDDSDVVGIKGAGKKGRVFKTDNEKFFEDL